AATLLVEERHDPQRHGESWRKNDRRERCSLAADAHESQYRDHGQVHQEKGSEGTRENPLQALHHLADPPGPAFATAHYTSDPGQFHGAAGGSCLRESFPTPVPGSKEEDQRPGPRDHDRVAVSGPALTPAKLTRVPHAVARKPESGDSPEN